MEVKVSRERLPERRRARRVSKSFPRKFRVKDDVPVFALKKLIRVNFALSIFPFPKNAPRRLRTIRRQFEHVADDAVVRLRVNPHLA